MSEDNYPKTYEACPLCQCPVRIVEEAVNEEKKAGKIKPERQPCSTQKLIPVMDPMAGSLIFPVLMIHYDYCEDCGYEYPHVITRQKMTYDQFENLLRQQMGMVGKGN